MYALKSILFALKAIASCFESVTPPAATVELIQLADPDDDDLVEFKLVIVSRAHEDVVACLHATFAELAEVK